MLCRRLLVVALVSSVAGTGALASERAQPSPAPTVADFLPPPLPALPPLPEELTARGFVTEFTARLSVIDRRLPAAEKADRAALLQFYADRSYQPVWVDKNGLTPVAHALVAEISNADDWGLEASSFEFPALASLATLTRDALADVEVEIGLAVLRYARHARGGRAEPRGISRNLDRRPPLLDPAEVIATAADRGDPASYLRSLHPQHPQFERLRQRYLAIRGAEAEARVEPVALTEGKPSRKRSAQVQQRGLANTLLANMEQWRWMPQNLGGYYVWVNIPEFTLRVVADGEIVHDERVIVGKTVSQTPVFSDEIQHVIFHPFWGVPDSIKKNELLPSLVRGNVDVLARNNLRIQYRGRDIDPLSVDWSQADMRKFHVYQPPGADNVLGVVKFRFPNEHAVYIHDTPSKKLFNASVRAFSHGCMRVRDPVKLASLLLTQDPKWSAEKVNTAVRRGPKNNWVPLTQKVPVHITYFTAWVTDDGEIKLHGDIYGHERRIAAAIVRGSVQVAHRSPPKKDAVANVERSSTTRRQASAPPRRVSRRSDSDWMRRIFNP